MPSNSAIRTILAVVPPFLMLLGLILIVSGIFNAMYSVTSFPSDNQIVTVYPRLFVGFAIGIVGVIVSVFAYLLMYNKIGIARYFKDNGP